MCFGEVTDIQTEVNAPVSICLFICLVSKPKPVMLITLSTYLNDIYIEIIFADLDITHYVYMCVCLDTGHLTIKHDC